MLNKKDYMNFKKLLMEVIKNDDELCEFIIDEKPVAKNNTILDAITFLKSDMSMSLCPCFYVNGFYEQYANSFIDIDDIIDIIKEKLLECLQDKNDKKDNMMQIMKLIDSKSSILKNVELCVRDLNSNIKLVENLPHRKFLDLVVYYQVGLQINEEKVSIKINNYIIENFDINEEELFYNAICNLGNANNYGISMLQVINSLHGLPYEKCYTKEDIMIVLKNDTGLNGSNNIFNIALLDEVANAFNSDLYILPSSIHELIVVPINMTNEEDNDINMFRDMVCSVNNDNVDLMDKLSDSVYKYIRAIKRVELA